MILIIRDMVEGNLRKLNYHIGELSEEAGFNHSIQSESCKF